MFNRLNFLSSLIVGLLIGVVLGWYGHDYKQTRALHSQTSDARLTNERLPMLDDAARQKTLRPEGLNLSQLLQNKMYQVAMAHFESLQKNSDSLMLNQSRIEILLYAQQQIKNDQAELSVQLLQQYLLLNYRDGEARILLAEAYAQMHDYISAIDELFLAKGMAYQEKTLARINQRIRSLVYRQAEQYRKNSEHQALLELFTEMSQMQPDYAVWFIELAQAQLLLSHSDAALYSLTLVSSDPDVGEQARALLLSLRASVDSAKTLESHSEETEISAIPLIRHGQSFLVSASSENTESFKMLIDTGATMTILSPDVLKLKGLSYQDTGQTRVFNTANGAISAPIYLLENLNVGDWVVSQLEIGVLELKGFDGLLGMNFLSNFQFFIDQHESMLRLSAN